MQAVNFLVISDVGLENKNNKAEWVKAHQIKDKQTYP